MQPDRVAPVPVRAHGALRLAVLLGTLACQGAATETAYPHAAEPIGSVRAMYDGTLSPELAVNTFRNIDRLFPVRTVPAAPVPSPLRAGRTPLRDVVFIDRGHAYDLHQLIALNRIGALLVLHEDSVLLEQYALDNSARTRWMSMSIAKSITSTLVGAALRDGKIRSLDDSVTHYVPALRGSAYDGVTVREVLEMASGVQWTETYTDSSSDRRHLLEAQIAQQPGGALALMRALPRAAPPGTVNHYNTGETQVAAEIVRAAVGMPLADYLERRIWRPSGMEADANWWLDSPDGSEIGGSGFSATLRDYGRFGLFILRDGIVGTDTVLPPGWVHEATTPRTLRSGVTIDYGYLWWPRTSAVGRRDSAFTAQGIHGQFIYVNPTVRVVVVIWSAQPRPSGGAAVDVRPFFDAVADSIRERRPVTGGPRGT